MPLSVTQQKAETYRQRVTGDTRYFLKGQYAFVLRTKDGASQFPLLLNPEDFTYKLPFAAELTPLQEGGVVAEEGGIVIGEITINGTTGFKPRLSLADISARQGEPEFTGGVDPGGRIALNSSSSLPVSGHMHFWRLANRCFDQYSFLKKNAATAHTTVMEFHNLKDELHLTVVPREFELRRTAQRERVGYRYSIRLSVIGPASGRLDLAAGPDDKWLKKLKDRTGNMRVAVQRLSAEVNNITAAMDEIRRVISGAAGLIDDVGTILKSATNFLSGVREVLDIPRAFIAATASLAEDAADLLASGGTLPADVRDSFSIISDQLDALSVSAQDAFARALDDVQRSMEKRTDGYRAGVDDGKDTQIQSQAQTAAGAQGRMRVSAVFGQGTRPGDVIRGRLSPAQAGPRFEVGKFKGFREVLVQQGDSVQSLAAKYMGDPNEWPSIVLANRMKAPYITSGAQIPNTVQPGDRISIPIPDNQQTADTFTTGNTDVGAQIDALLGVDIERERLPNGKFGWAIDTAKGSTDVRKIRGLANLGQGLEGRLRTERGHNILYPQAGPRRQIGNRIAGDDMVGAQFEYRQQLLADKRVQRITSLNFTNDLDVQTMEASVVPLGFSSERTIMRQLT